MPKMYAKTFRKEYPDGTDLDDIIADALHAEHKDANPHFPFSREWHAWNKTFTDKRRAMRAAQRIARDAENDYAQ